MIAGENSTGVQEAKRGVVVAIDGPAGAGKSTLAKEMARRLGLPYVNTGMMYRALASKALMDGVDPDDAAGLTALVPEIRFDLGPSPSGGDELLIEGELPSPSLSSPGVEGVVSRIARHPPVRALMREAQRHLGVGGCVMEGRDIGTVVFPDADLKIFLSAEPVVRARRREEERGGGDEVAAAVARRDALDARTNPLAPASDAHVLDTTTLDKEQVLAEALRLFPGHGSERGRGVSGTEPGRSGGPPRVAVVGRPNVGKSTLVNRLLGRRATIAHEMSGVTRDRVELAVQWGGRRFMVVDTGGIGRRPSGLEANVARQAAVAAESADLILLVVDVTTGITDEDEALARRLRRAPRPVVVVANKVDSEAQEPLAAEFHGLGLGDPLTISALHGRGSGELLDRILDLMPDGTEPQLEDEARFCLVGRPNVGKSSLFNRLVSEERAIVHEEPGTTRDAVDSIIRLDGRAIRFIDTAGFRRGPKARGVEYYGVVRSLRALDSAHVALLVIDASEGLTGEDKRVAAQVGESGRGLVATLNKWDLVPRGDREARFLDMQEALALFPGTPVVRTSALTGLGVNRLLPSLLAVHSAWTRRVATSEVNRVLEEAQGANPTPRQSGRIMYGTQVGTGPPRFVLFGARDPGPSYARYLENTLRKELGFDGVPLRLSFRPRRRGRGGAR